MPKKTIEANENDWKIISRLKIDRNLDTVSDALHIIVSEWENK